jgi:hypothetical protein
VGPNIFLSSEILSIFLFSVRVSNEASYTSKTAEKNYSFVSFRTRMDRPSMGRGNHMNRMTGKTPYRNCVDNYLHPIIQSVLSSIHRKVASSILDWVIWIFLDIILPAPLWSWGHWRLQYPMTIRAISQLVICRYNSPSPNHSEHPSYTNYCDFYTCGPQTSPQWQLLHFFEKCWTPMV